MTYAQLVGNDTDANLANGDVLAVNSVWAPAGATVLNNAVAKTVTYTPAPDFSGPAWFVYRTKDATSATSANLATVSIAVTPVNDTPVTGNVPTNDTDSFTYPRDRRELSVTLP